MFVPPTDLTLNLAKSVWQSKSLKLKSPSIWTEGSVLLMVSPNVIKLFSEQLKFLTSASRRSIPTCHKMKRFVCKLIHPN